MPAKINKFKVTTDPGQRFVKSNHAHKFLDCGPFTVNKRLTELHQVYIKTRGRYYPVQFAVVKVVDFGDV